MARTKVCYLLDASIPFRKNCGFFPLRNGILPLPGLFRFDLVFFPFPVFVSVLVYFFRFRRDFSCFGGRYFFWHREKCFRFDKDLFHAEGLLLRFQHFFSASKQCDKGAASKHFPATKKYFYPFGARRVASRQKQAIAEASKEADERPKQKEARKRYKASKSKLDKQNCRPEKNVFAAATQNATKN